MNIDRISIISSRNYDSISIFMLGLEFTAKVVPTCALAFVLENFPNENVTLLDLSKPNAQVQIIQTKVTQ
jgi:hypothetical protein